MARLPEDVPAIVRRVMQLVQPAIERPDWTAPGRIAAACRFCSDPVTLVIDYQDNRVRISVDHELPFCAEFARAYEDVEVRP